MKRLRLLLIAVVLLVAGAAGFVWSAGLAPGPGQIVIPAKTPFTRGRFFAFAQPWGGEEVAWTRRWAPHADAMGIHLEKFPDGTTMNWRWPPIMAGTGPGVWGYIQVGYGNYDGGEPEVHVPPRRVRDIRVLRQSYAWRLDHPLGDGNVLTELYLRSNPGDIHSKTLEIGWFLHVPDSTRRWIAAARPVGIFVDGQKRRWKVALADEFCMFMPEDGRDLPGGSLDMLPALRWLQARGLVRGDEWLTGFAIGVEPVRGVGRFHLDRWRPAFE